MRRRRSWGTSLGYAAAAGALLVAAGPGVRPASARTADAVVSCAGSNTIGFSPGLGPAPRDTSISGSGQYTCVSTDPAVRWGTSTIAGRGENSCLVSGSVTRERITWNTGEVSTVVYDLGIVPQPLGEAVVLAGGRVVSGKFRGRTVLSPGAQLTIDPVRCATAEGVELISGPSTLVIV